MNLRSKIKQAKKSIKKKKTVATVYIILRILVILCLFLEKKVRKCFHTD